MDSLEIAFAGGFLVTWLTASIRLAGPLLLTSLGEIYDELTGVLNIGIEGTMLLGALVSFLVSLGTGSPWLGLFAAVLVGVLANLFLAWMYVTVQANQVVVGIVFNILALGLTSYLYAVFRGGGAGAQKAPMLSKVDLPVLSDLPYVGPVLFNHSILVYVTFALALVGGYILYNTKFGLNLRAVGEHPRAADTAGINVFRMRYIGVLISGATAGIAGGYLVVSELGFFRDNMIAGRGFIALAIVIFGRWNPYLAIPAALVFGAADALQLSLQIFNIGIPPQVLLSLPYVLTIIAMSGLLGRAQMPSALMQPYRKE
jgi:simple sugar transport system permease protein